MKKLSRDFYNRDTIQVAKDLLGKYLVHIHDGIKQMGKIVEVEAYLGSHDLASHSSKGLTPRTKVMFGAPGYAYIYLIYGIYHCINVVTEETGHASAVLIRALEPIKDITLKTQGPGLLCKAMHLTKEFNGHDLLSDNLFIAESETDALITIIKRPRVGIDYAKHWSKRLLRFYIKDNFYISKK